MKRLLILIFAAGSLLWGQNIMTVQNVSGDALDTAIVEISIDNTDSFTGFQFDIPLPAVASYIQNSSELTSRASVHQLSASLIDENTLRVFAYSMEMENFTGNSGVVCMFKIKLGTDPGDYTLSLQDPIIGNDQSQNILTQAVSGIVTLQAPDININPAYLDYDRVALLESSDLSFTISNTGNSSLSITGLNTDHQDFEILGATNFVVQAGQSQTVTVRFNSTVKGQYNKTVSIESDDPDESLTQVDLSVLAYAVNELNIQNVFGRSGYASTLTIDLSNMEEIVGFSFDLNIPDVMSYIPGSAVLTDRKTDHTISASTLENGKVRVVAYSPLNEPFTGNTGDLVQLDFMINGIGGYYSLQFIDPVLGDIHTDNVISDDYGGTLEIAAPDIHVNTSSVNYGDVSILDTATETLIINNYGSDVLEISSITLNDPHFSIDESFPIHINPGSQALVDIQFHSDEKGPYSSSLRIRSNDPDEDPLNVTLSANAFIPNIMQVDSATFLINDTGWISISIENHEPIVGFQFELIIPDDLLYADEIRLTDRAVDHTVQANLIDPNTLSLFAYSLNQTPFSGVEGSVVEIKIHAGDRSGYYPLELQNVIIGNAQAENVMSSYVNNTITVLGESGFSLTEGWNLISWNVDTENDSVPVLLSDILEDVIVILGFDETGFTYDPSLPAFSTLQTMDHTHGYWIKTTQQNQVSLIGSHVYADTPIPLKKGWNLVSYLPHQADSLTHALSSIMNHIVVVLGFDHSGQTFDPVWPQFSNLKILSPGYGYWIKTTESCDLIYPNTTVHNKKD